MVTVGIVFFDDGRGGGAKAKATVDGGTHWW
jgi:hypothetical protein